MPLNVSATYENGVVSATEPSLAMANARRFLTVNRHVAQTERSIDAFLSLRDADLANSADYAF